MTSTKRRTSELDKGIGRRLRQLRNLRGQTQKELAAAVGLTYQQIQKYERGDNRISFVRLVDFCRVLDAPINYFCDETALCQSDSPFLTKEELNLIKNYRNSTRRVRRAIRYLSVALIGRAGE